MLVCCALEYRQKSVRGQPLGFVAGDVKGRAYCGQLCVALQRLDVRKDRIRHRQHGVGEERCRMPVHNRID